MRRFLLLIIAAAALALAAAGCGSDGSSGTTSSSTPAAPAKGGKGTVTVDMQNIQFAPKAVTVKVGQKITWDNLDSVDHNVTAKSGASFQSSNFGHGGTYSFTPKKAGTIQYTCTLHPGMDGTIVVR